MKSRTEKDLLGEMTLPADVPWGIHTERAIHNFPLPGPRVPHGLLAALLVVKKACAMANVELGYLDAEKGAVIIEACDRLAANPEPCPLSALQGGAGTSTNMLVNELIAREAGPEIHPLEEVNLHQSTNDVYPTALKLAAILNLRSVASSMEGLQGAFQRLEKKFAHIPVVGMTECVEAVPMTLGSIFGGFSEAFARDRWRTFKCEERLRVVNLGGTAVGTGLTAPRDYIFLVTDKLREISGVGLSRGENLVDQTANADVFVEVSGIMKACAVNLLKVSSDLRLMQMNGLIALPALQAGSSIMPGKVNPVILESVMQVGIQVQANDWIVAECASRGSMQINEFLPLLGSALLESMELLECAGGMLGRHAEEISADEAVCLRRFNASEEIITAFLPKIGYDRVEALLKRFRQSDEINFRAFLCDELGEEMVDQVLDPQNLMSLGHKTQPKPEREQ